MWYWWYKIWNKTHFNTARFRFHLLFWQAFAVLSVKKIPHASPYIFAWINWTVLAALNPSQFGPNTKKIYCLAPTLEFAPAKLSELAIKRYQTAIYILQYDIKCTILLDPKFNFLKLAVAVCRSSQGSRVSRKISHCRRFLLHQLSILFRWLGECVSTSRVPDDEINKPLRLLRDVEHGVNMQPLEP